MKGLIIISAFMLSLSASAKKPFQDDLTREELSKVAETLVLEMQTFKPWQQEYSDIAEEHNDVLDRLKLKENLENREKKRTGRFHKVN